MTRQQPSSFTEWAAEMTRTAEACRGEPGLEQIVTGNLALAEMLRKAARMEAALAEIEVAVDDVDHEQYPLCLALQPITGHCSCGVQRIRAAIEAAKVTT